MSTFNQNGAIQDVIGNETIDDQYDVNPTLDLVGTYIDPYMSGNIYGDRQVVFSMHDTISASIPGLAFDYSSLSNLFTTKQILVQIANRNIGLVDNAERIYDTMLPAVDEIMDKDNVPGLLLFDNQIYSKNDTLITSYVTYFLDAYEGWRYNIASSSTDASISSWQNAQENNLIVPYSNRSWTKSFPFSSKYAGLQRYLNPVKRSVDTSHTYFTHVNSNNNSASYITSNPLATQSHRLRFAWPASGSINESWDLNYISDTNGIAFSMDTHGAYNTLQAILASAELASFSGVDFVEASDQDHIKIFYGFGDKNTLLFNPSGSVNFVEFPLDIMPASQAACSTYITRSTGGGSPSFWHFSASLPIKPIIRGWKYGVYSGLPTKTKAVWRRDHYGQFRDLLEQRIDTKFYIAGKVDRNLEEKYVNSSPVQIRFINLNGDVINPASSTRSSNISEEATSSLPYTADIATNR